MSNKLLDNRYKILQTLARGGFGETYLATDTRMPSGKKCVIKKLKAVRETDAEQDRSWFAARFAREATILEQLGETNPQIPRLYAYFCEAGNYYLVQEWIAGLTLTQKQQEVGRLAEAEVKKILTEILPVLSYVHDRQIVHRDIKPDNIILRASDNKPVLIDFGAVKEAMTSEAERSRSIMLSVAIGTPGYMPSEQAAGRPLYSSDLYALGMTAIYLLTGKIPQNLETDPQNGEIIWQKQRRIFDRNLARVIETAIRFHPRDRFPSAKEMLAALDTDTDNVTIATVAVAPKQAATAAPTRVKSPVAAIEQPAENYTLKLALPLLIFGGLGIGSFLFGSSLYSQAPQLDTSREPKPREREEIAKDDPSSEPIITKEPETSEPPRADPGKDISEIIEPHYSEYNRERRPKTEPKAKKPQPEPIVSKNSDRGVPIFITGEDKNRVIAALGQPTLNQRGYFPNTRAMSYINFVPDRVNLGYIYDIHTGKLRQTEVSFERRSVDLKVMEKTLSELLNGHSPEYVRAALKEVYSGRTDMRSFRIGNYRGTIKKEKRRDRIYIGVWDADFH